MEDSPFQFYPCDCFQVRIDDGNADDGDDDDDLSRMYLSFLVMGWGA